MKSNSSRARIQRPKRQGWAADWVGPIAMTLIIAYAMFGSASEVNADIEPVDVIETEVSSTVLERPATEVATNPDPVAAPGAEKARQHHIEAGSARTVGGAS